MFFLPCLGFDSSPTGLQSNHLPAAVRDNPRWRRARPPCHHVHRRASNVQSGEWPNDDILPINMAFAAEILISPSFFEAAPPLGSHVLHNNETQSLNRVGSSSGTKVPLPCKFDQSI